MRIIGFDDFCTFMKDVIEKKNIKQNEDQVILCSGYEGTGKSTFTIATYCNICKKRKQKPQNEMIFYEWREYLQTNLNAMIHQLKDYKSDIVEELLVYYDIKPSELEMDKTHLIPKKGDILCYDEAGTQAFNRESMHGKNIKQAKLMISNRFLNLTHIWNVPHPMSADPYVRDQRTKILILCDSFYTKNLEQKIRNIYVYDKEGYTKILNRPYWQKEIKIPRYMANQVPPAMAIKLPDNLMDYIPKKIHEHYLIKKNVFNIRQILDMKSEMKEIEKSDKNIDYVQMLVQDGENLYDWVTRTELSPTQFYAYGGSRKKQK